MNLECSTFRDLRMDLEWARDHRYSYYYELPTYNNIIQREWVCVCTFYANKIQKIIHFIPHGGGVVYIVLIDWVPWLSASIHKLMISCCIWAMYRIWWWQCNTKYGHVMIKIVMHCPIFFSFPTQAKRFISELSRIADHTSSSTFTVQQLRDIVKVEFVMESLWCSPSFVINFIFCRGLVCKWGVLKISSIPSITRTTC